MEALSVFQKEYPIKFGDVDFSKKLKLSALFNSLQETASIHAEKLGVGFDVLRSRYGATWVLIRMKAEILEYPVLHDTVTIETWFQRPKKVEFDRDFTVRDSKGRILVNAVSTWVLLDLASRELKKSDSIEFDFPEVREERAIEGRPDKLRPFGTPETSYEKRVLYSDIDLNGHLNSSRYVDFIMDCFTLEEHKKNRVSSIQVNYVNEAFCGETFLLRKNVSAENPGLIYIEGIKQEGASLVFKSLIEIHPQTGDR